MNPGTVSLRCRLCGMVLRTAGPRITEEALQAMREHTRQAHPRETLPADADAGVADTLKHFDVEREQ